MQVQIAGFSVLECADFDEALEVTSKNPSRLVAV
jgi:hypothetical protein